MSSWPVWIVTHCNTLQNTTTEMCVLASSGRVKSLMRLPLKHTATYCYTLQRTATLCNALQRAAAHWNTLQHTATETVEWMSQVTRIRLPLKGTGTRWNTLEHTGTHWNTLQHTATHCNTLRDSVTHCNRDVRLGVEWMGQVAHMRFPRQHTATHCKTLQHTAAHCNRHVRLGVKRMSQLTYF